MNDNLEEILKKKMAEAEAEAQKEEVRDAQREQTKALRANAPEVQADHIMRFFTFEHLPPALRQISEPFCNLAQAIATGLPRNPERTVALRKLLEAKDAAVRCFIG